MPFVVGDRVVTAVLEQPTNRRPVACTKSAGKAGAAAQAQKIADLAHRVQTGEAELVDVSHLSGEDAVEFMLNRK